MIALLLQMIPLGIAAAISPVGAIGGIAVTTGKHPTADSLAYNLGGLLVYLVIGLIAIIWFQGEHEFGHGGHPSTLTSSIKVVIGGALLVLALFYWFIARESTSPKWIETAGALNPPGAFLLGMVVLSPRIKNLSLLFAAFAYVAAAGVGFVSDGLALLLFLALTFVPTLAPLAVYLALPRE